MKLGNVKFETDLDDIERMVEDLNEEIDDAVDEAASEIASEGLKAAKNQIRTTDRIWNRDVLNNWVPVNDYSGDGVTMVGFRNYSPHAATVDQGRRPNGPRPNYGNIKSYVLSNGYHEPGQADQAAYALMEHIAEHGFEGIYYIDKAEKKMDEIAPSILRKEINK